MSQSPVPFAPETLETLHRAVRLATDLRHDREALMNGAVRANVRASVNQLQHGSAILERLVAEDGWLVVGAEYSLETGVVEFFEGLPE